MDTEYISDLRAQRARVVETQREYLDSIHREKRLPSEEENVVLTRQDADFDELTAQIDIAEKRAQRDAEHDIARESIEPFVRPSDKPRADEKSQLERWFRGQADGYQPGGVFEVDMQPTVRMFQLIRNGADAQELRALYSDGGASAGSLVVPVDFYNQIYTYIEESSGVRRVARILTSDGGNPWTFPKTSTIAVGTQVKAQGTALAGSDPVLGTMRLDAYRYGELVKVSNQFLRDAGFPLMPYIAEQVGYAVGRVAGSDYVNGAGSAGPNGIITAASVGATTGGSLIALGGGAAVSFTGNADPLIALQHSISEPYANRGAFMMNRLTGGTLRRLKDGGNGTIGSYIWNSGNTFDGAKPGVAGVLFGSPVVYDWNFGTNGSAVKPVAFGDWSAYYIRDVGKFRFEMSSERYFDTDEVGFRGVLETDGDLIDTGAIKVLQQAV